MTLTITDFLLARITEDEEVALCAIAVTGDRNWFQAPRISSTDTQVERHVAYWPPTRVLAECAAKRQIVERYAARLEQVNSAGHPAHLYDPVLSMLLKDDRYVLANLAQVYAAHPDYNPAWESA